MRRKGTHTYDIFLQYHRCPKCGYIIESREGYQYRLGKYQKDLECDRCEKRFTLTKKSNDTLGPFIGEPQPVEMEWRDKT